MQKKGLFIAIFLSLQMFLWSNPQNPNVVSGTVTFDTPDSKILNVTASDRSIINWDSFSIDIGETTFFNLPSSTATVLNRVTTSDASVISGFLNSNGQVYLINQNGILISDQGIINTAAFLASTLDVMDSEFVMGGDLMFTGTTQNGVVNKGQIVGWNGDVILMGFTVNNEQLLEADNGVVALGAGQQILLTPADSQKITVLLSMGSIEATVGANHNGVIKALQAELKADGSLYSLAVQTNGLISATSTATVDGRIYLVAPQGVALVDGRVFATGFDRTGGEIQILGDTVVLTDSAKIDASGETGGGTILIGGSFQGMDPFILNSNLTFIDASVSILANAGSTGNGGEVVVWSDDQTYFYGLISANGGNFSGNGGLVEVSGVMFLDFEGTVSTLAPNGMTGTLLMDPTDITINTAGPTTALFNVPPCGTNTYCGGVANSAVIMISDLLAQLLLTNVIVDSSSGGGTSSGTIILSNPLTIPVGSNNLTLNARSTITINGVLTNNSTSTITLNSAITNTAAGNVTFNANVINGSTGSINVNSGIMSNGNISFSAGINLTNSGNGSINLQSGSIPNGTTGTITTSATSTLTNSGTSGTISFTAQGSSGLVALSISGPIVSSSTGSFQLVATQGNIFTAGTTTLNFTTGAPITIQGSSATSVTTLAGTSMNFTGPGGSLTVSSNGGIAINAPINSYSFSGPAQFITTTGSITGNASALMTFNSGSGDVSFSTTTGPIQFNVNAPWVFNVGAGNLNLVGNGINTQNSITFNSGVGKAMTVTGAASYVFGNITYNSTGNAVFMTGSLGVASNAGTTLNWGPTSAAGNLAIITTGPITLNGGITFSNIAGGLTLTAATNITTSAMSYSSPSNAVFSNTGLGLLTLTGPTTFNSGSGSLIVTFANTTALNAITLGNMFNYQTASPLSLIATTGNINCPGNFISNAGAPVTLQTFGTLGAINLLVPTFSGGAGPLHVLATGNITIGSILLSYTNPTVVTSSAGSIAFIGASIFSGAGGGLSLTANTSLSISSLLNYNCLSTNPVTLTSQANNIYIFNPFLLSTPAPLIMTTSPNGMDILVENKITNASTASTATITVLTGRDLFVGQEQAGVAQIGSAGGDLNFTIGRDVNVHATADLGSVAGVAQIGFDSANITSNINFTSIGRNLIVKGGALSNSYAVIGHGSTLVTNGGNRTNCNITIGSPMNPIGGDVIVSSFEVPLEFLPISNSFAQIGHLRSISGTTVNASGDIKIYASGSVTVSGKNGTGCYGMIGHGGGPSGQADTFAGNVIVNAAGSIYVQGGVNTNSLGSIGHAGILSSPGVLTFKSDLVNVVSSGGEIAITTGSGAEALIGLYVKGTVASSTGSITARTPMTIPQINVQSGFGFDISMTGAVPSNSFNGVFIGSAAMRNTVPLTAAGTDASNVVVTSGGNISIVSGNGGTSNSTFARIFNGLTLPGSGAYNVSISASGNLDIIANNFEAGVNSLGTLTTNAMGIFSLFSSSTGKAFHFSGGAQTVTAGGISMEASSISFISAISNSAGNLTISSGLTNLFGFSTISTPGSLMLTTSNDFFLGETCVVSGNNFNIGVTGNLILVSGFNTVISGTTTSNLTVTENIYLIGDPLGNASIFCLADLTVMSTGGNIVLLATPTLQNAFISSSGNLNVTAAESITLLDSAFMRATSTGMFNLSANGNIVLNNGKLQQAGTGTLSVSAAAIEAANGSSISSGSTSALTVNATGGDFSIGDNSIVTNTGTGGISSTVAQTLYLQSGPAGGAQISTGNGGGTISANVININSLPGKNAIIQSTGGTLTVSSTASLSLNGGGQIFMAAGSGILHVNVGTDYLADSGSSINNAGTGGLSLVVTGAASILNSSSVHSGGILTFTSGKDMNLTAGVTVAASGTTIVASSQDLTASGASITSTSSLSLSSALNLSLFNGSNASVTSGSGNLSFTATTGNLTLYNNSIIQNSGTGSITATIGNDALIRGGISGDSFIAANTGLTMNIPGVLNIEAAIGGKGYILSAGTTSVTASKVCISGFSSIVHGFIENSSGNLTVSAGAIILENFGHIRITAGSGLLSVNATNTDMNIGNGSFLQNQGTGALSCNVNKNIYIIGGTAGAASILAGTGGGTISSGSLLISGNSSINHGIISASQGGLTITTTAETILNPHATITLLGGSSDFQLTIGNDLYLGNDSLLNNSGTGLTKIQVTGAANFFAGAGDAKLQGGTGAMTFTISDSLHLLSDFTGTASISSLGNVTISSLQDVLLVGSPAMSLTSFIETSLGLLSVSSGQTMTLRDAAHIAITGGSGLLTLAVASDLNVENGSFIRNTGTGNLAITANANTLLRSGNAGNSFFSTQGLLTLLSQGDLNIESVSSTTASISSNGNSSISSGKLLQLGSSIDNALGNLTVNVGSANLLNGSSITLGAMSAGLLQINSTSGDFRIANDSTVQNLGTGGFNSTISKTLFLEGGPLGGVTIDAGSGGLTIQSGSVLLTGFDMGSEATITASSGTFTLTTTSLVSLNPYGIISLTGGSGLFQLTLGADLLIANGSSISNSGIGVTNVNVAGVMTVLGGAGNSSLSGGSGVFTLTVGDNLHVITDTAGVASITSSGLMSVSSGADITVLGAPEAMLTGFISSSSGSLSITAGNNIVVSDAGNIYITSGSGTLTLTTTNGDFYIQNGSAVQQQGTGPINASIKKNTFIKAGVAGSAFLSTNAALTLNSLGDISIESVSNAAAFISSNAASSVTSGRLLITGYNTSFPARILNSSGNLTVSAGTIDMIDAARILLTAGSGILRVDATAGNFTLGNGSFIQNSGSGATTSSTSGSLYLEGGSLGAASILGGNGGANVSAAFILMNGISSLNNAVISAMQGVLSVTTTKNLNLTPFSQIVLLGGTNNLNVIVGGNLYLADNTTIHNFGSGMTNQMVSGTTFTCH